MTSLWRHLWLTYRGYRVFLSSRCAKLMVWRVLKVWWWSVCNFARYRGKTRGGQKIAPPCQSRDILWCIKCPDVFKTSCLLFHFVLLIERWRSAKCKGYRMPSGGSASASNIHHPPMSATARTLTKCPQKHLLGRASWQANIRWLAMPQTRWPNIAALLWAMPPGPQRGRRPL